MSCVDLLFHVLLSVLNKPCVPITLCVWALTPFPTFPYIVVSIVLCASFCPCSASPLLVRYYPHVLSISRNCLAPPHSPESLHIMFYPSVYLRSSHFLYRRKFVISLCVSFLCIDSCFLLSFWFLFLVLSVSLVQYCFYSCILLLAVLPLLH